MPVVPLRKGQTADPFGNYNKNKDQSRMPSGPGVHGPRPTQTEMFMAAAIMDTHGLLFDPTPMPGPKYFIERQRDLSDEKGMPPPSEKPDNDPQGPPSGRTKVAGR